MSPKTNFQVNTHIQPNLFIFNQLLQPIEKSPTQMSNDSSSLFKALGPEPSHEKRPKSAEGPVKFDGNSTDSVETDIPASNGKNTTPLRDQNVLTPTVCPHKTQKRKQRRYSSMQVQLPHLGSFLICSLAGSRASAQAKRERRRRMERVEGHLRRRKFKIRSTVRRQVVPPSPMW